MSKEHDSSPYSSSSHWSSPTSAKPYPPPGGCYPASASYAQQQQHPGANDMVTLPPPQSHLQHEMYRPHNSYDMYQGPPPPGPPPPGPQHQPGPPPHAQMHYQQQHPNSASFNQPAPRQRTAIACRYCRRRKIRCHGFDSSPDGRCTNCLRFHQECIFTPVSSQAHAFVPAHTAYPHLRNTGRAGPPHPATPGPDGRGAMYPPIYGAHGQPLPMSHQGGGPHDPGYPPPGPPPPGYGASPYPGPGYDDRSPLPPHAQDQQRLAPAGRRSSSGAFEYPDPTQMSGGPGGPGGGGPGGGGPGGPPPNSYGAAPYPPAGPSPQQPYYPSSQPPPPPGPPSAGGRRHSPPSAGGYSYDPHGRASVSPHGSTSSSGFPPFPGGLHPPQVLPPTFEAGRTPPPPQREGGGGSGSGGSSGGANGTRPGMSVRDMLGPDGGPSRSSTDSDMLKALNRGGV